MSWSGIRAALVAATIGVGVVTSAVGVAVLPLAPTLAAPTPVFTLEFGGLEPGVAEMRSDSFELDREATLVDFAWVERTGVLADAALIVELCGIGPGCIDPTTAGDTFFYPGTMFVNVTAQLPPTAQGGEPGVLLGQFTFTAPELASTGWDAAPWLAAGAALVTVGVLFAALGRRPRRAPS